METSPLASVNTRKRGRNSDKATEPKKQRYSLRGMDKSRAATDQRRKSAKGSVDQAQDEFDSNDSCEGGPGAEEQEIVGVSALNQLKDLVQKSIEASTNVTKSLEHAIENGTNKCMAAIDRGLETCTERIRAVEDRVDVLDNGLQELRKDVEQLQNRTVKASKNLVKDEQEFATCRKSVVIWPVEYKEGETTEELHEAAEQFFLEKMKVQKTEWLCINGFEVTRPLVAGRKLCDAPVHVTFQSVDDRDFVMSLSGKLRSESGERNGTIRMKLPRFLTSLRNKLEAQAKKIRDEKGIWTQLRLTDDSDMLAIYSKDPNNSTSRWQKVVIKDHFKKSFA